MSPVLGPDSKIHGAVNFAVNFSVNFRGEFYPIGMTHISGADMKNPRTQKWTPDSKIHRRIHGPVGLKFWGQHGWQIWEHSGIAGRCFSEDILQPKMRRPAESNRNRGPASGANSDEA